jgi:predicted MFS family arabinose efflux permease
VFTFGVTEGNLYAMIGGLALLVAFWLIEHRAKAPLVAVSILSRPTVKWGNAACLVVFSMEPALIFLTTLYLQEVLHFAPMTTGLIFGVPGLAAVAAGIVAGRFIGRYGSRNVLAIGLLVQTGFTAPLILLGASNAWLAVLIPALFLGFFGHVTAIVASMVTATSDVPDSEQGLATGLASMTQQVGITVGIPVLGAVAATQASLLGGIHLALAVNVLVTVAAVVLIWTGLRPRSQVASDEPAEGTSLRAAQAVAV